MNRIFWLSGRPPHGEPVQPDADGDAGSAAIELTLLAPLIILLLLLIVYAGRAVNARGQVDTAAHTAARAASIARSPAQAVAAAEQAVAPDPAGSDGPCTALTVQVDTSQFRPGGVVRATVECRLDQSDLAAGLPIPGQRTLTTTASAPIDVYRGITVTAAFWPPAGTGKSLLREVV
ncbi:TadE/TadG family type IV pilus assembly protein [Parafrankia discariae]|uniref:TadE/TadG family type IV pilus assembly protein n=1 Tax=Parafrankia discariae TaxID=365528 RepID=UPI00036F36BB|nr:TadE/TadG family type IV pilus assembly protein [Parafrankia discariae]